jgi:hypothetical protein
MAISWSLHGKRRAPLAAPRCNEIALMDKMERAVDAPEAFEFALEVIGLFARLTKEVLELSRVVGEVVVVHGVYGERQSFKWCAVRCSSREAGVILGFAWVL